MGILDKLRPQPRWKHTDPDVRLHALPEIPETDAPSVLAEIAATDPDPRVRRGALDLIDDVAVIAGVAGRDADAGVRDAAFDALASIAADAATDPAVAAHAAGALADERRLTTVARTSPHAAARDAALALVRDEKSLGSIARQAADEATAHAAAGRLTDTGALVDVALNGAHRDVAMAAFERVVGDDPNGHDDAARERLDHIATRSQQKAVARRAKAMLQAMADAEAARKAAEEERHRAQAAIVEVIEGLTTGREWRSAESALLRARESWAASGEAADEALAARFDAASGAARAWIDEQRAAEAAEAARAEEQARARTAREALCARLERAEARAEDADIARSEWEGMPPSAPADAALQQRFERAIALCVKRDAQRASAGEAAETLKAIAAEAASLSGNTLDEAVSRLKSLRRRWNETEQILTDVAMDLPAEAVEQMRAAEEAVTGREAEARETKLKVSAERVSRIERLADRADRIAKAGEITLREGDRMLRDAKIALDEPAGDLRGDASYDAAVARLRGLLEQVAPRVRELRELDDWRRFANAQAQEDLIKKAEALAAGLEADAAAGREPDLGKAAATLRDLQSRWKTAAEAPRDKAQELWHRFRTPVDAVRARCAEYFAKQAGERAGNIQKKQDLCARAEALAESVDWVQTAEAFRALQAEWQATGPIPPREARALWDRFRKASDRFFTRRRDDLAARKAVWTENLAKKEALCERAEALAESTDWDAAASEFKRLQADWKTIGPVRKSRSEAIWKRFRSAADRFFERYHNRHQAALQQKAADREALVVELEAMAASETEPETLGARVQDLRAKLRVPSPLPRAEADAQNERVFTAISGLVKKWPAAFQGTDLDPEAALKRMEKLCAKAESLAAATDAREEEAAPMSQAEALAARLRQALNANAFGAKTPEDRGPSLADQIKELQGAWQRLVIPQTDAAHALEARFKRGIAAAKDRGKSKRELTRA